MEVQKRVGVEEKKAVVEEDVGDNPANVEELEDMLSRAITEYRVVKASADDMVGWWIRWRILLSTRWSSV